MSKKNHPYHLVDPSPWPFVASIGIFILFLGSILYLQEISQIVFWIGCCSVFFALFGWWKDIIAEAKTKQHNSVVRTGFKYGMTLFILSEIMFFVAFFWAYFNAALFPSDSIGGVWPPKGLQIIDVWDLPYLNTLILLLSGTTVTWAHDSMINGDVKEMVRLTGVTIFLGILFLIVQTYEYFHAPFTLSGGIYPSVFYLATGFHGFHVLVGVCMLIVCLVRARSGHFRINDHFGFDAAVWYWHFVDIVWLFLFIAIYWWGA